MPQLAGALTGLGLLALPAIPSPTYFETQAPTDTWSISVADSAAPQVSVAPSDSWALSLTDSSEVGIANAVGGSDTWSASFAEAGALFTFPAERTQLSPLALPIAYHAITAKAVSSALDVNGTDTWSLSWTETPTDLVSVDTWDTWALSVTEIAALGITQTFAPADSWALSWLDVGNVLAGGPILVERSDTWSLSLSETAEVAATTDASDTWSMSLSDSAAVDVVSDEKLGSDAWSLSFALETAFFSPIVEIPILTSDEWRISLNETTSVVSASLAVPSKRRIKVDGPSRNTRIQ